MAVGRIFKQTRKVIVGEATVLLVMVGALDYATGWELSVSLLYALVILMVAWGVNRRSALVFAGASAVFWCVANLRVHPYATEWAYAWATFTRLAYFVFVAVGGASLRAYQESNRARIEALERARDLEHEIARISEREQRRIGQDLHDGICQSLAAIQYALSSLREDLEDPRPAEAAAIHDIAGMVKNTIAETRNLARGIFPVQMEEAGLAAVLDELVSTLKRQRIQAVFEMQGEVRISNPEVSMHLYRIAQEAVSNALKHGRPGKLTLSLREEAAGLRLTISDNGGGLPAKPSSSHGMGLKTMRHRANLIGASLEIRGNSTGGVSVVCLLPKNDHSMPAVPALHDTKA